MIFFRFRDERLQLSSMIALLIHYRMVAVASSVFAEQQRSLRSALRHDERSDWFTRIDFPQTRQWRGRSSSYRVPFPLRVEWKHRTKLRTISLRNGKRKKKRKTEKRKVSPPVIRFRHRALRAALPRAINHPPLPRLDMSKDSLQCNATSRAQRGIVRKQRPAAWSPSGDALIPPWDENGKRFDWRTWRDWSQRRFQRNALMDASCHRRTLVLMAGFFLFAKAAFPERRGTFEPAGLIAARSSVHAAKTANW
jgi:hypothetical protein